MSLRLSLSFLCAAVLAAACSSPPSAPVAVETAAPPPTETAPPPPPPPNFRPLTPGMALVRAGVFRMGSPDGEADELPVHEVSVASFELDLTEVTVGAYKACVASGKCTAPSSGQWSTYYEGDPTRPVNHVSSVQAEAFCAVEGKRLPTEEEWEFAARGPEGRTYPWGDDPPFPMMGCWARESSEGPCPVGAFPASDTPTGLKDMAGNLWEWTSSGYNGVYETPRDMTRRIYRGGSWQDVHTLTARAKNRLVESSTRRFRNKPTIFGPMVGIRCAKTYEGPLPPRTEAEEAAEDRWRKAKEDRAALSIDEAEIPPAARPEQILKLARERWLRTAPSVPSTAPRLACSAGGEWGKLCCVEERDQLRTLLCVGKTRNLRGCAALFDCELRPR